MNIEAIQAAEAGVKSARAKFKAVQRQRSPICVATLQFLNARSGTHWQENEVLTLSSNVIEALNFAIRSDKLSDATGLARAERAEKLLPEFVEAADQLQAAKGGLTRAMNDLRNACASLADKLCEHWQSKSDALRAEVVERVLPYSADRTNAMAAANLCEEPRVLFRRGGEFYTLAANIRAGHHDYDFPKLIARLADAVVESEE
jgi:hypothetical protein